MKKIITIIIIFILALGSFGYYAYVTSQSQVINSNQVFDDPKNFFPFQTADTHPSSSSTNIQNITPTSTTNVKKQIPPKTGLRIVTNGITNPNIDTNYRGTTAYQQDGKSLDATTDNYVTVPENTIPIGSRVYIVDRETGHDIWGVVGDYGPYKGISLYAAEQLGIWQTGMGMKLLPHTLEFKYYER